MELESKHALQFCFYLGLAKVLSSLFPGPTYTLDNASASNIEDQHTYNNIASFVFVELDCIQFDYILYGDLEVPHVGSNTGPT